MKQGIKLIPIFLILAVPIFFLSCPRSEQFAVRTASLSNDKLESGKASLTYSEGLVIFISGQVYVKGQGDWEMVEIGNIVTSAEIVKVGANSLCELQFGEKSVVRIQENSEIMLKDLWLKPGETDIGINLTVGSVLCKVSKLSATDSFKVRTRTAVCGVRGTEFRVGVSDVKGTTLAVKEGKVAIIPESVEADNIQEREEIKNSEVRALLAGLENSALVVSKDEEVSLDAKTNGQAGDLVKTMISEIETADKKEVLTKDDLGTVDLLIARTNKEITNIINSPQTVSPENKEELKALDKVEIKEVIVVPESLTADQAAMEEKKGVPVLVKIKISTDPNDADIFLDGLFMGKGKFQKIYEEGIPLHFTIEKSGYTKESLTVETNKSGQKEYKVVLAKLTPEDAKKEDAAREANIKAKDELNKEAALKADKDKKPAVIEREVVPIKRIKAAPASFIGDIIPAGELMTAADKQGTVYAFDDKGNIIWSMATQNNPNYNSWPSVIGGNIYFAGSREFLIGKADSGKVLKKRVLAAAENQMFGRRVVASGDNGLFATDNSIQVIDLETGDMLKEYALPGGSLMTPAVYQGKIYIVNLTGEILVIDSQGGTAEPKSLQTEAMAPIAVPICIFQGRGYFCDRKGLLVAVDLGNMRVLWQKRLDASGKVYPRQEICAQKQGIYLFAGGKIYGYASLSGTPLFNPLASATAPPLYWQNKLYYGRDDGTLVIADAGTGKVQRLIKIDARLSSRPFARGKELILATDKGEILIVREVL